MTALGLLAAIPVVMWLAQSVWLRCAAQPLRARINPPDLPERARRFNRIVTYSCFVALILLFPLTRGRSPLAYFLELLPMKDAARPALFGAAAAILYLALLHLAWVVTDNVRFRMRQSAGQLVSKLAGVPLTAILAAGTEELIFRGIVLRDLLDWLPGEGALLLVSRSSPGRITSAR